MTTVSTDTASGGNPAATTAATATAGADSRTSTRYPFRFSGSGSEYFRIWIVNILLSIITLYIYSAWAKVRTRRYFYGNTLLDGSSFEYHARPTQIVFGRMLAMVLLLVATLADVLHPGVSIAATVLLFLLLPWALWRSQMFNARMSSYRNVRFDFVGGVGPYYLNMVLLPGSIVAIVGGIVYLASGELVAGNVADDNALGALGVRISSAVGSGVSVMYLAWPWLQRRMATFTIDHHRYGKAPFRSTLSTGGYYRLYLLSILFIAVLLLLIVAPLFVLGRLVDLQGESAVALLITALYLLFAAGSILVYAFFRTRLRNYQFARTAVDGRVQLESSFTTAGYAGVLIANLLLMLLTVGLYYPWARVRLARYMASHTTVIAYGSLDGFAGAERERVSALGEEIGDAFDMDVGLGF